MESLAVPHVTAWTFQQQSLWHVKKFNRNEGNITLPSIAWKNSVQLLHKLFTRCWPCWWRIWPSALILNSFEQWSLKETVLGCGPCQRRFTVVNYVTAWVVTLCFNRVVEHWSNPPGVILFAILVTCDGQDFTIMTLWKIISYLQKYEADL